MSKFEPGPACPTYRHGMTNTPEHNCWQAMLQRCQNQNTRKMTKVHLRKQSEVKEVA